MKTPLSSILLSVVLTPLLLSAPQPAGAAVPVTLRSQVIGSSPSQLLLCDGHRVLRTAVDRELPAPAAGSWVRVVGSIDPHLDPSLVRAGVIERLAAAGSWPTSAGKGGDDEDDDDDGGGGGGGGGGGDSDDDEGVDFESQGFLVSLHPPAGFELDDQRRYEVNASTRYESGLASYADLQPGQLLEVRAIRLAGGAHLAERIELEGDVDDGGRQELAGVVSAVDASGLTLDQSTRVLFSAATEFKGDADAWTDLAPGWWVEVEAVALANGDLSALSVRGDDSQPATVTGEDYEPHQALVVPMPGVDAASLASRHGATLLGTVGHMALLLWWPDDIDDELIATLDADPAVRAVEPNYLFRDPESVRRRYPIVDRSGGVDKVSNQAATAAIGMARAHATARGHGVTVAIMDTGVDPTHPAIAAHIAAGGLDLVDGDAEPWERRDGFDNDGDGDVDEAAGHGSFVASLIAAAAPAATILPYRVLDDDGGGTAYALSLALADAIDRGVDVINLSLVYQRRSSAVDLLLEEAAMRGIIIVASAGNDGSTTIPFPASDSHVVGVTALSESGATLASFANRSAAVVLAAPGESVYGALDDGLYGLSSGTSMATPFVSAGAALLLALDPRLDPTLLRLTLAQSGRALSDGAWSGSALALDAAVSIVGTSPAAPIRRPDSVALD